MLRSALYSLSTLALLGVGFYFYWRAQPAVVQTNVSAPATRPATRPSDQAQLGVGPGANPWVNSFDEKGRLASQFKAAEYLPQKDRSFKVVRPVSVHYLGDGQFLVVTGDTGVVFVDATSGEASATAMQMSAPAMSAPNHGILYNVHVGLFSATNADRPTLTLKVNNLSFDNDTLRLYTQSFTDETGATIPADKVPVEVRGDDYEFDGSGLTINWNDRDRHLQLLEIAHGGRLQIKHPNKMSTPWSPKATVASLGNPLPEALAAANPAAAGLVLAAPPAPTPTPTPAKRAAATSPAPKSPYHAVFNDNVRVEQGERQMASADVMVVDFLPGGGQQPQKRAGAKPLTATTAGAAATQAGSPDEEHAPPAAERLAAEPTTAQDASPSPLAKGPASAPTTRELPVTVYWTGKLRITPLETAPVMPLAEGQAAIRLVGSPVELTPEATVIHAAAVTYRNDGAVRLESSNALPLVELMQDKGLTFTSEGFDYDPATELATITGRSDMHLPLEGRREQLTASWTRRGVLHFVGKAAQPDSIDHVDLTGRVHVDHPDFNIKSNRLVLDLEKPPATPASPTTKSSQNTGAVVKRATAIGNVICRLVHDGQADRGIDADQLVMETAAAPGGKRLPRSVVADGSVNAFDPTQHFQAGHLETLLVPKAKPTTPTTAVAAGAKGANAADMGGEVEVESLLARSNVHAVLKSGAIADADEVRVVTKNGKPEVELRGATGQGGEAAPASDASISDGKGGTLTGPVLHVAPERSLVTVDGPGAMRAQRRTSPTAPARPIQVTWTNSLTVDAPGNTVDAIGNVAVKTTDPDGAVSTLTADTAHLDLADAKPPPKKNSTRAAATQPADDNAFGNKELKAMLLQGNVHGESLVTAADGGTLHRAELKGSKLTYDAATGRTEVPGEGHLILEDHRPQPAGASENRGTMFAQWTNRLLYDEQAHQILIDGTAKVGFRQDSKDAAPMLLASDTVTVDLVPVKSPATKPAAPTAPVAAADPAAAMGRMQMQHARAVGHVEFKVQGKDFRFHAHQVDYDPATDSMIAHGSDVDPAYMEDELGATRDTFDTLVFDTRKQEVVSVTKIKATVGK